MTAEQVHGALFSGEVKRASLMMDSGQYVLIEKGDKLKMDGNILLIFSKKGKNRGLVECGAIEAIQVFL